MVMLNMKSGIPIWEQIRDSFKKQILAGVLNSGDKLPSVRALASELGINPNTIQRAYTDLENSGFVYMVSGRGCFVAEKSEASLIAEQTSRINELKKALHLVREAGVLKSTIIEIIEKEWQDDNDK